MSTDDEETQLWLKRRGQRKRLRGAIEQLESRTFGDVAVGDVFDPTTLRRIRDVTKPYPGTISADELLELLTWLDELIDRVETNE